MKVLKAAMDASMFKTVHSNGMDIAVLHTPEEMEAALVTSILASDRQCRSGLNAAEPKEALFSVRPKDDDADLGM